MICVNSKLNTKHGFDRIYKTMLYHNCSFIEALLIIINTRTIFINNCIDNLNAVLDDNIMVGKTIDSFLRGGFHK